MITHDDIPTPAPRPFWQECVLAILIAAVPPLAYEASRAIRRMSRKKKADS